MIGCDVLVVGGGPAGLAVALELAHLGSLTVLVVERTAYDQPRIGETLSPGARTLLDHLRVTDGFDAEGHVQAYGTAAAWGSPDLATRDFLMTPFGTGWHLDRRRFDARLATDAEWAGAVVWRGSRIRRLAEVADGFDVAVEHDGAIADLGPQFVVDATGKSAAIARRLSTGRRRLDRQVAVAGTFRVPDGVASESQTLVEACELGWWYTANLPDHELVAALVTDADLVRAHGLAREPVWRDTLSRVPHTAARVSAARLTTRPRIVAAYSAVLVPAVGARWLAVGDAAASHDPLSASGIVRALDSGIHAARSIHAALVLGRPEALAEYDQRNRLAYDQYCVTRAAYYQMEGRWADAPFWRRRQRHVTLDPRGWLASGIGDRGPGEVPLPADLGHVDAGLLLTLAAPGRRAHEIVSEYQVRASRPASDLDVVLALQWLLARGALRAVGGSLADGDHPASRSSGRS